MILTDIMTNIVAGLLVIGFGIIVGNIFGILIKRGMESLEVEQILWSMKITFPLGSFLSAVIKYGTYIAGLVWGLTFFGLETIVLYIVLFVLLFIFLLFIILSFRDFIENAIAGIFVHRGQRVRLGQQVVVDSVEGKVISMDSLEVRIKAHDGDVLVIPNILLARKVVTIKKK